MPRITTITSRSANSRTRYQNDIAKNVRSGKQDAADRLTLEWQHKRETAALEHRQYLQQLCCGSKIIYRAGWDREREELQYRQDAEDLALRQKLELAEVRRGLPADGALPDDLEEAERIEEQRDLVALAELRHRLERSELANTHKWNLAEIDLQAAWDRFIWQGGMDSGCMAVQYAKDLQEMEVRHGRELATTTLLGQNVQKMLRLAIQRNDKGIQRIGDEFLPRAKRQIQNPPPPSSCKIG